MQFPYWQSANRIPQIFLLQEMCSVEEKCKGADEIFKCKYITGCKNKPRLTLRCMIPPVTNLGKVLWMRTSLPSYRGPHSVHYPSVMLLGKSAAGNLSLCTTFCTLPHRKMGTLCSHDEDMTGISTAYLNLASSCGDKIVWPRERWRSGNVMGRRVSQE